MVAVRQFDTDAVLAKAGELFWEHGYGATSIGALEKATGVKRGSLYNAFGSKEGLFLAVFARYEAEIEERLLGRAEGPGLLTRIRGLFATLAMGRAGSGPSGCLITNSATELGGREDAAGQAVADRLSRTLDRWVKITKAARDRGELAPGTDPETLARVLAAQMRALPLVSRSEGPAEAQRTADAFVELLSPRFRTPPPA